MEKRMRFLILPLTRGRKNPSGAESNPDGIQATAPLDIPGITRPFQDFPGATNSPEVTQNLRSTCPSPTFPGNSCRAAFPRKEAQPGVCSRRGRAGCRRSGRTLSTTDGAGKHSRGCSGRPQGALEAPRDRPDPGGRGETSQERQIRREEEDPWKTNPRREKIPRGRNRSRLPENAVPALFPTPGRFWGKFGEVLDGEEPGGGKRMGMGA